jgi:hypothetical protein
MNLARALVTATAAGALLWALAIFAIVEIVRSLGGTL